MRRLSRPRLRGRRHILALFLDEQPLDCSSLSVVDRRFEQVLQPPYVGDAQELAATRILKHAEMVRFDGWPATMAALREGKVDAVAGNRVTTPNNARELPGSRLLDDRFGKQELALFVRKDRAAALGYVDDFVKQAIASGLVQKIVERSGRPGLKVAAP